MARTRLGKIFRTRRGRLGRYKYINGRRVSFVATKPRRNRFRSKRKYYNRRY